MGNQWGAHSSSATAPGRSAARADRSRRRMHCWTDSCSGTNSIPGPTMARSRAVRTADVGTPSCQPHQRRASIGNLRSSGAVAASISASLKPGCNRVASWTSCSCHRRSSASSSSVVSTGASSSSDRIRACPRRIHAMACGSQADGRRVSHSLQQWAVPGLREPLPLRLRPTCHAADAASSPGLMAPSASPTHRGKRTDPANRTHPCTSCEPSLRSLRLRPVGAVDLAARRVDSTPCMSPLWLTGFGSVARRVPGWPA